VSARASTHVRQREAPDRKASRQRSNSRTETEGRSRSSVATSSDHSARGSSRCSSRRVVAIQSAPPRRTMSRTVDRCAAWSSTSSSSCSGAGARTRKLGVAAASTVFASGTVYVVRQGRPMTMR